MKMKNKTKQNKNNMRGIRGYESKMCVICFLITDLYV